MSHKSEFLFLFEQTLDGSPLSLRQLNPVYCGVERVCQELEDWGTYTKDPNPVQGCKQVIVPLEHSVRKCWLKTFNICLEFLLKIANTKNFFDLIKL